MNRIILLVISIITLNSCNSLKRGTFNLYENGVYIGNIYRLNQYQIEEFDSTVLVAKLNWKTKTSLNNLYIN